MKKNYLKQCLIALMALMMSHVMSQEKASVKKLIKFPQELKLSSTNSETVLRTEFANGNSNYAFNLLESKTDPHGFTIQKFEQYYKGVKVEFGTVNVVSKNNTISAISGEFVDEKSSNAIPTLTKSDAFGRAVSYVNAESYLWELENSSGIAGDYQKPEGEIVFISQNQTDIIQLKLAYKFDIYAVEPLYRAE
ncbi:MAG: hypothetical protein AAF901_13500, partial [Bacteroidota bacterium]